MDLTVEQAEYKILIRMFHALCMCNHVIRCTVIEVMKRKALKHSLHGKTAASVFM